ncbi:FecCD transport family protein [Herbihabitans rhizosphaerae]|uniref:FecCD transport family protein n=1 Tax=Herbihabitans rhizosphaerae TaxID=1872711 RepID=A0A4Q7KJ64_9PSEU|nr:FecCD transport family protein [Herbihabitans rhizosphaerae]
MQALTRNPLADPGLFGVNSGATLAVVSAVVFLGMTRPSEYVIFALLGAGVTAAAVYALGVGGRASSHTRLALSGIAVTATQQAIMSVVAVVAPLVAAGALMAATLAGALNTLALGEDTGRALGAHPGRTRALGILAVLLLCGAATAGSGRSASLDSRCRTWPA